METISFTKHSLQEFIFSEKFDNLTNIPISKHRAVSQINNPRADDEDIILIAQFDENKTTGYIGILPDYIFQNDKKEKMGWVSCFWVDDNYKSNNVSADLFWKALKAWDRKLFITNIVPTLETVYEKTNLFLPKTYKTGYRGYLRFNLAEILPPKKHFLKKLTFLFKLTDWFLNLFVKIRLLFFKVQLHNDIKYEYLNSIDESSEKFVNKYLNSWNNRGIKELNWIIKYPWILEKPEKDFESKRYYFSSVNQRFFYELIKLTDKNNNIKAIILLNIRENNLTVPYAFFNKEDALLISNVLVKKLIDLKLNMITVFNEDLSASFHSINTPFIFSKRIKKAYFISKKFDFINQLNFQDGDGDCAFY